MGKASWWDDVDDLFGMFDMDTAKAAEKTKKKKKKKEVSEGPKPLRTPEADRQSGYYAGRRGCEE